MTQRQSGAASAPPARGGAERVSVIVPVHNDGEGLASLLDALLEQTWPAGSCEILIVDNGSTDDTPAVAERYRARAPDRVAVLREARRGSYAARNRGIEAATGSVLAFTDADCVPAPDWIEAGVRALEAGAAELAAGRIAMTFAGPEPTPWEYFDAVRKLNQRAYAEVYGFGATANLFVRRAVIERRGAFRADLQSGGDYEFGRRATGAGERLVYAEAAMVEHPARGSLQEILKKTRRVTRGQRELDRLGLLDHGRLTWRRLVPTRRCPPLPSGATAPLRHRATFLLLSNAVKYYAAALQLAGRLR